MVRQVVLHRPTGSVHLEEVVADDEAQLQEQLKAHPELLPVDEFGLDGPIMVIGRETSLPSGAADLVGIARGGEVVIVEFKTGPQNTDFRHTLAQLLDYGSDAWQMDADAFETTVAHRYFTSDHCPPHAPTRGAETLAEAARITWALEEDELARFGERWRRALDRGEFHYVVAAQRFTPTMERTIEYLNDQSRAARFYAVEFVRFRGADLEAFEARCVLRPARSRPSTAGSTDESQLLEQVGERDYREALQELLDFARGQQLALEWGSVGVSLRIRVPGVNEPLSIAWIFPPGASGWSGLRDVTLGHDTWRAEKDIGDSELLDDYLRAISQIDGVEPIENKSVRGYRIPSASLVNHSAALLEAIAQLTQAVGART